MMEVYIDDMIVKSSADTLHTQYVQRVFKRVRKYNMRLNPENWTFTMRADKFLGFYLREQAIEAKPDKCEVFI